MISLLQRMFGKSSVSMSFLQKLLDYESDSDIACVVAWIGSPIGSTFFDIWLKTSDGDFFEHREIALPISAVARMDKSLRCRNMNQVVSRLTDNGPANFNGMKRDGEIISVCFGTRAGSISIDARGYNENPKLKDLSDYLREQAKVNTEAAGQET